MKKIIILIIIVVATMLSSSAQQWVTPKGYSKNYSNQSSDQSFLESLRGVAEYDSYLGLANFGASSELGLFSLEVLTNTQWDVFGNFKVSYPVDESGVFDVFIGAGIGMDNKYTLTPVPGAPDGTYLKEHTPEFRSYPMAGVRVNFGRVAFEGYMHPSRSWDFQGKWAGVIVMKIGLPRKWGR